MNIAKYEWASLISRMSAFAPIDKATVINNMCSLSNQSANWNTKGEFVSYVSFFHETVHFYQDLLTGVGHNDYLVYKELFPQVFIWFKEMNKITNIVPYNLSHPLYKTDEHFKFCCDNYLQNLKRAINNFVFEKTKYLTRQERIFNLKNHFNLVFPNKQITDEEIESYLIEYLFESEAACTVQREIFNIFDKGCSPERANIAKSNDYLYLSSKMDKLYNASFSHVVNSVQESMKNVLTKKDIFDTSIFMYLFLVDIASAYPPSEILNSPRFLKSEFDPGVKYVRLLRALDKCTKEDGENIANAIRNNDPYTAEEILLRNCETDYPHSTNIYLKWMTIFENLAEEDDSEIIQLRIKASKIRSKMNHIGFYGKTVAGAIGDNIDIPLTFITKNDGLFTYSFSGHQLVDNYLSRLFIDISNWNSELELFNYFANTGTFSCILSENKYCSIASSSCLKIQNFNKLPNDIRCITKSKLSSFIL